MKGARRSLPAQHPGQKSYGHIFTDVVLLEQLVQAGQVLHDELPQDALVCLHAHQGGAEVGGRDQLFNDSAHHPEGIFLFQKEQQRGSHLGFEGRKTACQACRGEELLSPPHTDLCLGDQHLPFSLVALLQSLPWKGFLLRERKSVCPSPPDRLNYSTPLDTRCCSAPPSIGKNVSCGMNFPSTSLEAAASGSIASNPKIASSPAQLPQTERAHCKTTRRATHHAGALAISDLRVEPGKPP